MLARPRRTGGAAAIYGFVHQITASMAQLVQAQFGTDGTNVDSDTVIAILEPAPGGDIIVEGPQRRVLQFKHRNRTIPVGDVADTVLCDLFRAHCDREADAYELHTTNGVSAPGQTLIAALKAHARPARAGRATGDRVIGAVLDRLGTIYAAGSAGRRGFTPSFRRFIERFVIMPPISEEQARRQALEFLNRRVPYAETTEDALDQLIGYLARRSGQNDTHISVDELLARLGLPGLEVSRPGAATGRLAQALVQALGARAFDPALDVRAPFEVDPAQPITLVAGPSGRGKSWALYRIADELIRAGRPVVLVRAADRDDLDRQLRLTIAGHALAQQRPAEAGLLGDMWRRMVRDEPVTILWEGCRDPDILPALQLSGGLGPGLNVVIEIPAAHDDQLANGQHLPLHRVGDFTPSQLFEALKRRGVAAGEVPEMIRPMLLLPVLAGIYATLALEQPGWDPQNEYRVLESFWTRGRRLGGRLAGARLKALARVLVAGRKTSASDDDVAMLGFSDSELEALIAAGWLSDVGDRWSFAHDRLLTWAIAMSLVGDFETGALDADGLAGQVNLLQERDETDRTRLSGLGFLLMDVVWLAGALPGRTVALVAFLTLFEARERTGPRILYGELLHTAGRRMLPVLEARIAGLQNPDYELESAIVTGLRGFDLDAEEQAALCARLWVDEQGHGRSIAISLGRLWPLTAQRDALWENYCLLHGSQADHDLYERTEKALNLLVARDPAWLVQLIEQASSHDPLWLASFQLRSLDPEAGRAIWWQVAATLIAAIPAEHQSVLVDCVDRFGGVGDIVYLEARIRAGDATPADALAVLVDIDPERSLALLEEGLPSTLLSYGRGWFDQLLDLDRNRAIGAVNTLLLVRDPSGDALAALWSDVDECMDVDTIGLLLDRLEATLADVPPDRMRRSRLIDLLGSLTLDPIHDPLFVARRGTDLAQTVFARVIAHMDGVHDEHYTPVRRILRRIGGDAYEAFILHALSPDDLAAAHTGIITSIFAPTQAVVARLATLADRPPVLGGDDSPLLDLWRALLNIDPITWRPRMLALLERDDDDSKLLGMTLLPEYPGLDDEARVLACFERSAEGGAVEERAMNLAYELGTPGRPMVVRALARIGSVARSEVSPGVLSVLIEYNSPEARAALDAHLAPLETATSWNSLDEFAVAGRIGCGQVSAGLWRMGERMMRHSFISTDRFIGPLLAHDRARAMDVLLDRAFAVPEMLVTAQPQAVGLLATIEPALATQAFVQSWRQHPDRRKNLAISARTLQDPALAAIIDSLAEEFARHPRDPTYRMCCSVLRLRRSAALPLLSAHYALASHAERIALADSLGWLDDDGTIFQDLLSRETDRAVRRVLNANLRHWRHVAHAVEQFRTTGTLEAMEYALDVADPDVVRIPGEDLFITDIIRKDPRLTGFAERQLARRINEVEGTKYKRAAIRQAPEI